MTARPISIRINSDEYHLFASAIPAEEEFPATYYDWLKTGLKTSKKAVVQGKALNEVIVDYQGFITYCGSRGQKPSSSLLMAYTIKKTLGQV